MLSDRVIWEIREGATWTGVGSVPASTHIVDADGQKIGFYGEFPVGVSQPKFWGGTPPLDLGAHRTMAVSLTEEEMAIPDRREFRRMLTAKIQEEWDKLMAEWEKRHPQSGDGTCAG
jgi:hypothetical protein